MPPHILPLILSSRFSLSSSCLLYLSPVHFHSPFTFLLSSSSLLPLILSLSPHNYLPHLPIPSPSHCSLFHLPFPPPPSIPSPLTLSSTPHLFSPSISPSITPSHSPSPSLSLPLPRLNFVSLPSLSSSPGLPTSPFLSSLSYLNLLLPAQANPPVSLIANCPPMEDATQCFVCALTSSVPFFFF